MDQTIGLQISLDSYLGCQDYYHRPTPYPLPQYFVVEDDVVYQNEFHFEVELT